MHSVLMPAVPRKLITLISPTLARDETAIRLAYCQRVHRVGSLHKEHDLDIAGDVVASGKAQRGASFDLSRHGQFSGFPPG
jgi:hypothetical protein